jgi:hypothetical protein
MRPASFETAQVEPLNRFGSILSFCLPKYAPHPGLGSGRFRWKAW